MASPNLSPSAPDFFFHGSLRKRSAVACFQHGAELATASADLAGFISRSGGIESIIRGAAYSRTQAVDTAFASEISASSLLFNLPVEAVQRARDHGKQERELGRLSDDGRGGVSASISSCASGICITQPCLRWRLIRLREAGLVSSDSRRF